MAPKKAVTAYRPLTLRQGWDGNSVSTPTSGGSGIDNFYHYANGTQDLLISSGHPYRKLGRTHADIGGNFMVVRRELVEVPSATGHYRATTANHFLRKNYFGNFFAFNAQVSDTHWPPPSLPSNATLDAMGATAIARSIPTNPIGGLVTTLAELRREGLPSLVGVDTWRERTLRAKNAGSEYLNVEFGWKPLLDEIRTFVDTWRRSDEIVEKYVRESGKLLHRGYTWPEQVSSTTSSVASLPNPGLYSNMFAQPGVRTLVTVTRTRQWFEGAFTYHLPPQGTVAYDIAIADKLYGSRVTPEVVWNLTPWSWALDWISNTGDVVHNASRFMNDGLVMPYGYIMQEHSVSREYTHTGGVATWFNGKPNYPIGTLLQNFTTVVKSRRRATPFGFGLSFGSFTNRQKAILAALGLTRGGTGIKYE